MHFGTPHNKIECVLSVKESNFNKKKGSKFSHLLTVMAEVADPSPPTVSLTIKYPLLMTPSLRQVVKKNDFFTVRLP